MSVDPLAEKYPGISPYVYTANNPIMNIDINGDTITPMAFAKYSGYNLDRKHGINAGSFTLYGGATDNDKPVWVATTFSDEGYRDDYVMDIEDVGEFRKNSSKYLYLANFLDSGIAMGGNMQGDLGQAFKDCWTPTAVLNGLFILGEGVLFNAKSSIKLNKSQRKAINSLEKRIIEHENKLESYKADPYKFDNKRYLENAPNDAIRQKIINSRINHLKKEISTFRNNIKKIKRK